MSRFKNDKEFMLKYNPKDDEKLELIQDGEDGILSVKTNLEGDSQTIANELLKKIGEGNGADNLTINPNAGNGAVVAPDASVAPDNPNSSNSNINIELSGSSGATEATGEPEAPGAPGSSGAISATEEPEAPKAPEPSGGPSGEQLGGSKKRSLKKNKKHHKNTKKHKRTKQRRHKGKNSTLRK